MNVLRAPLGLWKPVTRGLFVLVFSILAVSAQETPRPAYVLHVDGLGCPFCAYGLEKSLTKISGVEGIETDIDTGIVIVTMAGGATLHPMAATRAVEHAGFTLRDFEETRIQGQSRPTQ